MKISIVAFGKLKTPGLRLAADYYLSQLRHWIPAEEIELKPIPVENKSSATRQKIQEKEAEILLQKISDRMNSRGCFYLLDENGKSLSTEKWVQLARSLENNGLNEICFCIGGSLGFLPSLKNQARDVISLGPQTLPHELTRVVLLEQLFRTWSVIRGHPYHNA